MYMEIKSFNLNVKIFNYFQSSQIFESKINNSFIKEVILYVNKLNQLNYKYFFKGSYKL